MGWEQFEQDCYNYLISNYGEYANFTKMGGEDSTVSDILVSLSYGGSYYIEVKKSSAQCGQFVLLPDDNAGQFVYSERNNSQLNEWSQQILDFMNVRYGEYRNAGTGGRDIHIEDTNVFVNWITDYYANKGVQYFMTCYGGGYVIFPIGKFAQYFNVTATYREKKSGSSNPGIRSRDDVEQLLLNNNVSNFGIEIVGKKMHVYTSDNIDGIRDAYGKYTYLFKRNAVNDYIVTRLSNTSNSNVIFSIRLRKGQDAEDLQHFINSFNPNQDFWQFQQ